MALAPSRLLLPVRAVDPAHPAALSSASVCSAAGVYPHFSLFFLHPPTHRSTPPVSARVSEAPSYRHNRHSQFHRQPNEAVPFDDLQSLYEEERGRLNYPNRNPNVRTYPAQRLGRGGGNSGRTTWEHSSYVPWRSHGVSEGEVNPRYGKPWSSLSRNSSSWASQTENVPGEMHRRRWRQTMEDQRSEKFDMRSRNMESPAFARRGSADNENRKSHWERQGSFYRQGSGGAHKGRGNFSRERQGSFSRRGSGGTYKDRGSSPLETQESFAQRGRFSQQDEQRVRQSPPWQDNGRESTWEGAYSEDRSGTNRRSQRHYDGDVGREQLGSQWTSRTRNSSSWQSSTRHGDLEEQAVLHGVGLGKNRHIHQSAKNSESFTLRDYPLAPWQNSVSKEWGTDREEVGKRGGEEEEVGYGYTEAKAELEGEEGQNSNSKNEISPIARIMERLRNVEDTASAQGTREGGRQSRGRLADYIKLPSAKEYLSDQSMPQPIIEESPKGEPDIRFPWEIEEVTREEDTTVERARRLRPLSTAELTISAPELKRLRILSVHLKQRVKIGKHGVTTDLVNSIMQRFRTCEVVKVKCEGPPAGNMKKTLEVLEQRTGSLIIWKAGSVAVLYRGKNFGQPLSDIVDDLLAKKLETLMSTDGQEVSSSVGVSVEDGVLHEDDTDKSDNLGLISDDTSEQATSNVSLVDAIKQEDDTYKPDNLGLIPDDKSERAPAQKKKKLGPEFENIEEYVMEVEDILSDLGPRYEEWIGPEPIPVDGDLLPAVIPDFRPPYRLLPFGVRPNLSNTLTTHLRRLSRPLAPHFVIGRDRGLQGLASAMVKLWEKSEIAKIGIKRGILNTDQERVAEDLKQLTGGFFLCRDKRSMTFYRGKDFLPQAVSVALSERQDMVQSLQDKEETGRWDRSLKVQQSNGNPDVKPSWVHVLNPEEQIRLKKEAVKARRLQIVNHIERRLKMALRKREKAGKELEKVEERMKPVSSSDDKELISDEERFMLRKLGLKMKAYLLVGRRGIFAGVVQNMHLHWKHRELVKIVVKEKDPVHLKEMASMLECESGGLLISIDPTSKGYAMIYYRGKNYTRPPQLRPPNLLTKRLALKRSVEIQRRLSLSKHIQTLEEEIVHLRAGLSKLSADPSESSQDQVLNEEGADAYGSQEHDGASDNQPTQIQSSVPPNSLWEKQQGATATVAEKCFNFSEDEDEMVVSQISKQKLRRLCEMGPIFRAVRLSNSKRHAFRNEVLKLSKAAQYMVGRSNPLSTVAKAIRLYFLDHAFIKIGVRNRPQDTSVQDIAEELEDLTGGTVYAQDDYKVVLYRGWPTGENMPLGELYDVLSLEQCDILEAEDDDDDNDDGDVEGEDILKSSLAEYSEKASGEENDDVDAKYEDDTIKEGDDGLMLADTSVKNTHYSADEDEDDDLQWDSMYDGNTEDDDDEEGADDDDDDLQWVGLADDSAEEEEEGDQELRLHNFSNEDAEKFSCVENDREVDIEGRLRWAGLAFSDDNRMVAGLNFDLDEDV